MTGGEALARVTSERPPPFALIHRPETTGTGSVDLVIGEMSTAERLADVPRVPGPPGTARHEVLAVVPYRQIGERGFACTDDGTPLLAMTVTEQATVPLDDVLAGIEDVPIRLTGEHFRPDDEEYQDTVRRIVREDIGRGAGSNFVIRRSFVADLTEEGTSAYSVRCALTFFRRLLRRESGAYWTFIVHTGDRTFVGATPERHVSLAGRVAVMNPISGTYRYPPTGPDLDEVMDFLADRKEADELYMVVDEELKMMARICESGGRVVGPYLKEMARLAHTEYFIEGRTDLDPRDILWETMFAPTVTGSPLENACRVIAAREPDGRGYYSGVLALIGRDERGESTMDSAILIRTAEIDRTGRASIGVGATLVRHSDPAAEAAETRAKAEGLLSALKPSGGSGFAEHPRVRAALQRRNDVVSGFWLATGGARRRVHPVLAGLRILVVDAEDTFTSMMDHQLRALGLAATVRRFDEPYTMDGYDLVLLGPGPGDPRETADPRMRHLSAAVETLLRTRKPFFAVCLSHQMLSLRLGLDLVRKDVPSQGEQREIDLFGRRERVGLYNTYTALSPSARLSRPGVGEVEVSREPDTGEVYALRGPHFASAQFHAESVLTSNGPEIVAGFLTDVLRGKEKSRQIESTGYGAHVRSLY